MNQDVSGRSLALVSAIPIDQGGGGGLQLYRHFEERKDFIIRDFTRRSTETVFMRWLGARIARGPIFMRLYRTRLHPWFLLAECAGGIHAEAKSLWDQIAGSRPSAIVTVAYGRECLVAAEIARISGLPLVTFFHDWWPDLVVGLNPTVKRFLDTRFRQIAWNSALILPVSRALSEELGSLPGTTVLPPIPACVEESCRADPDAGRDSRPLLVYAGTLGGAYGAMVRSLSEQLLSTPDAGWRLKAYGPASGWPEESLESATYAGIYGGVLGQGEQLNVALQEADALLVVMDFAADTRRRVRTSFPSKILDYAPFGKPLVVWGPEDCFAAVFAREHALGWVISQTDSSQVGSFFEDEWEVNKAAEFGRAMSALVRGEFSASQIHQTLKAAISHIL